MTTSRFVRLIIVFILPFILVVVLYYLFSVKGYLELGETNSTENDIKSYISSSLLKQEQRLEFFTPTIDPKWFLYSVKFQNDKKLAVQSDTGEPPYLERETSLVLLIDGKETLIKYGESKIISRNTRRVEILNEFSRYGFFFTGSSDQIFAPNSVVNIQNSPSLGTATYKIVLSCWSMFLIYFLGLVILSGLILVAKPLFQFVYYGKEWWFKI